MSKNVTQEIIVKNKPFDYSLLYEALTQEQLLSNTLNRKVNTVTDKSINWFIQNDVIYVAFYKDNKYSTSIYIDLLFKKIKGEYTPLELFMKRINEWLTSTGEGANLNWHVLYYDDEIQLLHRFLNREYKAVTV